MYVIEMAAGAAAFTKALDCPLGTESGCMVSGIDGAITYKIRVAGVDKAGVTGEFSEPITFLFASIQPLSPTLLTQTAATSSQPGKLAKRLSWTAVKGYRTGPLFPAGTVIDYRVYQAMTEPAVEIATTQTNFFTVQGLQKNKTYQFYVTCVVNGIESYTSPAVRVNT